MKRFSVFWTLISPCHIVNINNHMTLILKIISKMDSFPLISSRYIVRINKRMTHALNIFDNLGIFLLISPSYIVSINSDSDTENYQPV
jgi:hypothetical protein